MWLLLFFCKMIPNEWGTFCKMIRTRNFSKNYIHYQRQAGITSEHKLFDQKWQFSQFMMNILAGAEIFVRSWILLILMFSVCISKIDKKFISKKKRRVPTEILKILFFFFCSKKNVVPGQKWPYAWKARSWVNCWLVLRDRALSARWTQVGESISLILQTC